MQNDFFVLFASFEISGQAEITSETNRYLHNTT